MRAEHLALNLLDITVMASVSYSLVCPFLQTLEMTTRTQRKLWLQPPYLS
jgi:hypothetical protein